MYRKMNPIWKAKWIEALRSGKYTQNREGFLRVPDSKEDGYCHCCLGVLFDIYAPSKWKDNLGGYLPDFVSSNLNLGDSEDPEQQRLIIMNDTELKSFNEIADWIEENL